MQTAVKQKFDSYPEHIRPKMEQLRSLILDVAAGTEGVGELEETLKWGEPAWLPSKTGSGTTIRIDWKPKTPEQIGMYVSCNTTLVEQFRARFGNDLQYQGNRAVLLPAGQPLPRKALMICIRMALRYHLDTKE